MIRLRSPYSAPIVASRAAIVRVGAFSPNVDYIVAFAVPTVLGGLFGRVLWGTRGMFVGAGAGAAAGFVVARFSVIAWGAPG